MRHSKPSEIRVDGSVQKAPGRVALADFAAGAACDGAVASSISVAAPAIAVAVLRMFPPRQDAPLLRPLSALCQSIERRIAPKARRAAPPAAGVNSRYFLRRECRRRLA